MWTGGGVGWSVMGQVEEEGTERGTDGEERASAQEVSQWVGKF